MIVRRWWRYAVLRGEGLPAHLDGMWMDMDAMPELEPERPVYPGPGIVCEPTNQWEQRDDGEVAVVYRVHQAARPNPTRVVDNHGRLVRVG